VSVKRIPLITFLITSALLLMASNTALTVGGMGIHVPATGRPIGPSADHTPPPRLCMDNDAGWGGAWCLAGDGGPEASPVAGGQWTACTGDVRQVAFNGNQTALWMDAGSYCKVQDGGADLSGGDGGIYMAAWVYYPTPSVPINNAYPAVIFYSAGYVDEGSMGLVSIGPGTCTERTDALYQQWQPYIQGGTCDNPGPTVSTNAWHYWSIWHARVGATAVWEFAFWLDGSPTSSGTVTRSPNVAGDWSAPNNFFIGSVSGEHGVVMGQMGIRNYLPTDTQVAADYNYSKP